MHYRHVVTSLRWIQHRGHCELLRAAKALGEKLTVIVNNEQQNIAKYGFNYIKIEDAAECIRDNRHVDRIMIAYDKDETVCDTLQYLHSLSPIDCFAKGGDRNSETMNEKEKGICEQLGIKILYGVGGSNKLSSTSEILENCRNYYIKTLSQNINPMLFSGCTQIFDKDS